MAKNRKNMSVAIRFGPAIKALLICSLFVASGVGYVWQKSVIADLERQRTARIQELKKLETRNKQLREDLAGRTSPKGLNKLLMDFNLGLVEPKLGQVRSLPEPVGTPFPRPGNLAKQYAARP